MQLALQALHAVCIVRLCVVGMSILGGRSAQPRTRSRRSASLTLRAPVGARDSNERAPGGARRIVAAVVAAVAIAVAAGLIRVSAPRRLNAQFP